MYVLIRNNKRGEIVGIFIRDRVLFENSLRYSELGDGNGPGQSRESGCGGQQHTSDGQSKHVRLQTAIF